MRFQCAIFQALARLASPLLTGRFCRCFGAFAARFVSLLRSLWGAFNALSMRFRCATFRGPIACLYGRVRPRQTASDRARPCNDRASPCNDRVSPCNGRVRPFKTVCSTASHRPALQVLRRFCGSLCEPFPLAGAYQWKLALHWYVAAMCGSYHATSCIHVHAYTHLLQNLPEDCRASRSNRDIRQILFVSGQF
jgi:hypothetical protein